MIDIIVLMTLHDTLQMDIDHSTSVGNCVTGEVRLQDGPNVREGRVEVCINNAWGTVCNDQFGVKDAIVVCTQMNFSEKGTSVEITVYIRQLTLYLITEFTFHVFEANCIN